jgi:hypothetical protein
METTKLLAVDAGQEKKIAVFRIHIKQMESPSQ